MTWVHANIADQASAHVKTVCCGDLSCFGGRGCDTARWWTARLAKTGRRIVIDLSPRVVPANPTTGGGGDPV